MGERPVWNELTCDEGRCCSFSFWVDKEKRLMHLEDHTTKKTFNLASARSRPLLQFFSRSRGRAVSSLHSDAPPAGLPTLSRFSPMRGGSSHVPPRPPAPVLCGGHAPPRIGMACTAQTIASTSCSTKCLAKVEISQLLNLFFPAFL
jgi:hypothetical protein